MMVPPRILTRAGFLLSLLVPGIAAAATQAAPTIQVRSDGSVLVAAIPGAGAGEARSVVAREFGFGLPGTAPTHRELEGGQLPMTRSQWEKNGIRYTQLVLLTRLSPGELFPDGKPPGDAVLLVRITGENTASEYTEATAEFTARVDGRALELELRDGRVHLSSDGGARPLAVIEVPTTGVAGTRGTVLRFRGSMPPGTSGAMTVKIPLAPLKDEVAVSRLSELEFDEEFRRAKRCWADPAKAGDPRRFPLAFTGPEPDRLAE